MNKRFLIALFLILGLIVGLFVWSASDLHQEAKQHDDRIHVITTFLPIYVFTVNVTGDQADVTNLLPPGVGPHEYSFTPADVRRIASADVIVMNGKKLEEWMDQLIVQSGTKAKIIDASTSVSSTSDNPHVWLDPVHAQTMVQTIRDGFVAADYAHAEIYTKNAAVYFERLATLDSDYKKALSALSRKDFIAFHSAFTYLAGRYGMRERAVIEEFPGKEPTAQYLAQVVDLIKKEKVKAIFSEPQFSPAVIETVARETGTTVRELDTAETGAFAADTYEVIMKKNLTTLVEAFQ